MSVKGDVRIFVQKTCILITAFTVAGCSAAVSAPQPSGNILAIGDSIRQGWGRFLHCEQPADNCLDSRHGLKMLDQWTQGRHWKVVVFNFGLHDSFHRVPHDEYCRNLAEIVHRLNADRIYFCLTTPGRPNHSGVWALENIDAYNCVARWAMAREHIRLIDLHTLALDHRDWWKPGKDIHYTDEGYKQMADHIRHVIGTPTDKEPRQ